jgi:excisionase family DNA binding protein
VDFVNFDEAKKRLGKSDEELQDLIKKGDLRAFRDGATWKFRKEDIDAKAGGSAVGADKDAGDTLMSIDADILFAEEEEVPADSAAETWIAADTEGVFPGGKPPEEKPMGVQAAMAAPETEPAPLALSPESDDTSLHDVLSDDELAGSGTSGSDVADEAEPVIAVDSASGVAAVVSGGQSGIASRTRIVTLVEPPAHHGAFTVLLSLAVLAVGMTAFTLIAIMNGSKPSYVLSLGTGQTGLIVLAIGVAAVLVSVGIGYVLDKQRTARESVGG